MKETVWENIRTELRRLRGRNLLRGREEHFIHQDLVTLEVEQRGAGHPGKEVHLHLSDSEHDLVAEVVPDGPCLKMADYDYDLTRFMEAIAEVCRNKKPYLKTNRKQADYRRREI